jgi:hypothetical protein
MGGSDMTLDPGSDLLHLILRGRWEPEALDGADCAALVTRHREYEALDLRRLKDAMGGSVLVDGRNVFDLGLWLTAMNVQFRDVRYAIPFLVQAWMFATPIAYPSSLLDEPWRTLYDINLMAGVVEGFR